MSRFECIAHNKNDARMRGSQHLFMSSTPFCKRSKGTNNSSLPSDARRPAGCAKQLVVEQGGAGSLWVSFDKTCLLAIRCRCGQRAPAQCTVTPVATMPRQCIQQSPVMWGTVYNHISCSFNTNSVTRDQNYQILRTIHQIIPCGWHTKQTKSTQVSAARSLCTQSCWQQTLGLWQNSYTAWM